MNYTERIEKLNKDIDKKQGQIEKNKDKLLSGRLSVWEIRFVEQENEKLQSECNALLKKIVKCEEEINATIDVERVFDNLPTVLKEFSEEVVRVTDSKDAIGVNRVRNKVVSMYNKVLQLAGTVDDWSTIAFDGVSIFGRLVGDKNTVRVDTYVAGGSVQQIHNRILVRVDN